MELNQIWPFIQQHLSYLNNSKFFAGIVMIIMNIASRYVTLSFSKNQEYYLKFVLSRQFLIFAIAWMGTRDLILSLILTAVFIVLADYMLNEESDYCILPEKYKTLYSKLDTNKDGVVSDKEINDAINILEKAKKQKEKNVQLNMLNSLNNVSSMF